MGVLRIEIYGEHSWSTACRWKKAKDLMLMLHLKETMEISWLCKQCALVWSCVEEGGWSCLRRAMEF